MHTIAQAQQHAAQLLGPDVHPTDWHNLAAVGATIYALEGSKRAANQDLGAQVRDALLAHVNDCANLHGVKA